jgi:hypothetical protein
VSDRIDELGKLILDEFATADVSPAVFVKVGAFITELATIAREAERDVATLKDAYDEKCHAYTLLREATLSVEAEADKWRKVAEAAKVAMAAVEAKVSQFDAQVSRFMHIDSSTNWENTSMPLDLSLFIEIRAALAAVEQEEAE